MDYDACYNRGAPPFFPLALGSSTWELKISPPKTDFEKNQNFCRMKKIPWLKHTNNENHPKIGLFPTTLKKPPLYRNQLRRKSATSNIVARVSSGLHFFPSYSDFFHTRGDEKQSCAAFCTNRLEILQDMSADLFALKKSKI